MDQPEHTDVVVIGLDAAAHTIATDGWMRAADGVWAIGDVTGKGAFRHMSMYQAEDALAGLSVVSGIGSS